MTDIVLCEGAILDGKHRHRACVELGIEPRFRQYEGDDPAGFAFSANIAHRHLEKGQLAMAAVKLKEYFAGKAAERKLAGVKGDLPVNLPEGQERGDARDQAARKVGVSGQSVDMAQRIIDKGVPEGVENLPPVPGGPGANFGEHRGHAKPVPMRVPAICPRCPRCPRCFLQGGQELHVRSVPRCNDFVTSRVRVCCFVNTI